VLHKRYRYKGHFDFANFGIAGFRSSVCINKSPWVVRQGNIAVAGIWFPLPMKKNRPPVPIGSNLSQVDARSWQKVASILRYAGSCESYGLFLSMFRLGGGVDNVMEAKIDCREML
jgi:hypothetical protein